MRYVAMFILVMLFLVGYSYGYEDISQDNIKTLYDFTERFLTSYRSYVSFNLPEEIQNYKDEKGDYEFFLFKHKTLDIKIFYTHDDLIGILFTPSEKNEIGIVDYKEPYLNLFGISISTNSSGLGK